MASVQAASGFQGPGQLPAGLTKEMIGQVYTVRICSRFVIHYILHAQCAYASRVIYYAGNTLTVSRNTSK